MKLPASALWLECLTFLAERPLNRSAQLTFARFATNKAKIAYCFLLYMS